MPISSRTRLGSYIHTEQSVGRNEVVGLEGICPNSLALALQRLANAMRMRGIGEHVARQWRGSAPFVALGAASCRAAFPSLSPLGLQCLASGVSTRRPPPGALVSESLTRATPSTNSPCTPRDNCADAPPPTTPPPPTQPSPRRSFQISQVRS